MQPIGLFLSAFFVLTAASVLTADDTITLRGKDKPHKNVITEETTRGIVVKGLQGTVAPEDIIDIVYLVNDKVRITMYGQGVQFEKEFNDPDPKKDKERKSNLTKAIEKYNEAFAHPALTEKFAKRHIHYKIGVLLARKAQEDGGEPDAAIQKLADFKAKHPNSWQLTPAIHLLGRLQVQTKKFAEAEEAYLELAQADVPDPVKQEAELLAIQVGIQTGQPAKIDASLKKVNALIGKLPKGSKSHYLARIAQGECELAKKLPDGVNTLRQVLRETNDKTVKAIAYNTLGVNLYSADNPKEARWEFLWVDVVYNQDKNEHAKALYYLTLIFDKLGETERAQECRETLLNDRQFAGLPWPKMVPKGKGP